MNLENLKFQSSEGLGIVQFRTPEINTFEYISLSNALKNKLLEVTEINDFGSVNDLSVTNNSENFVFMSDGDILIGAKQNRVLNTSVLLAPKSKITIPVSCVERGRWRFKQKKFAGSDNYAPSSMRASKAADVKKNLKTQKVFYAKQSKVWNDVSKYEDNYGSKSETSDLSYVFDSQKSRLDELMRSIKPENDSNGIAMFIGGSLLSIEVFNRSYIFAEYFPKIIRGTLFEVLSIKNIEKRLIGEAEALYKAQDFFDKIDELTFEEHRSVGAGFDRRFDTKDMTGFELRYDHKHIHFVALNLKESNQT